MDYTQDDNLIGRNLEHNSKWFEYHTLSNSVKWADKLTIKLKFLYHCMIYTTLTK